MPRGGLYLGLSWQGGHGYTDLRCSIIPLQVDLDALKQWHGFPRVQVTIEFRDLSAWSEQCNASSAWESLLASGSFRADVDSNGAMIFLSCAVSLWGRMVRLQGDLLTGQSFKQ